MNSKQKLKPKLNRFVEPETQRVQYHIPIFVNQKNVNALRIEIKRKTRQNAEKNSIGVQSPLVMPTKLWRFEWSP